MAAELEFYTILLRRLTEMSSDSRPLVMLNTKSKDGSWDCLQINLGNHQYETGRSIHYDELVNIVLYFTEKLAFEDASNTLTLPNKGE